MRRLLYRDDGKMDTSYKIASDDVSLSQLVKQRYRQYDDRL